jgi:hypothetical protein
MSTLVSGALAGALGACKDAGPVISPAPAGSAQASVQFIDERFEQLYPWLLNYRALKIPERSARWLAGYKGRWVRWRGQVRSVTQHGITLRHLATTTTFDVSLMLQDHSGQKERHAFEVGDWVTYAGQLSAYDDVVRNITLMHGVILERHGGRDAGVLLDRIPQ